MDIYETHIQYNTKEHGDFFAIRNRTKDGKSCLYFYRDLAWLKENLEHDIPYDWNVVKANPDKWFLL